VSVALYMDVHVHRALTEGLRTRGVDVLTAQEDGTAEWEDPDLLERATAVNRVLFTNDRDFLRIVAERQQSGQPFVGVLYAPQASPLGRVLRDLELCALACEPGDFVDALTYLPFP
jgi:predicted nuclease of predicted toxin-antitoxin system